MADSNDSSSEIVPQNQGGVTHNDPLEFIGDERQAKLVRAIRSCGTVRQACKETEVAESTHYHWMASDIRYRRAVKYSRKFACSVIEGSLVDRLANGWKEPVFQQGRYVGDKTKYDNATALAYLDRHDADFREAKKDIAGKFQINNTIGIGIQQRLTEEERSAWAKEVLDAGNTD